jgi:carboxypeptidase Taq
LGFEDHPYNALLNEYEKGATVKAIDATFKDMLPALKALTDRIAAAPQVDDHFLQQHFPKEKQWEWGLYLIKELGFDEAAGRQDKSEHPFSISFNPQDVRITTRIDESDFSNMTWSCIHEAGHALYEQGLPLEHYGLPLGEACSYSIHESQSRLWENNVGRSKGFWEHFYPILTTYFPDQFKGISLEAFYKGINKVQPSLIRTEADEITYHSHVYIRYIIEKGLIEGSLAVADIPAYWNELYTKSGWGSWYPMIKGAAFRTYTGAMGALAISLLIAWGAFMQHSFSPRLKRPVPPLNKELSEGRSDSLLQLVKRKYSSKRQALYQ